MNETLSDRAGMDRIGVPVTCCRMLYRTTPIDFHKENDIVACFVEFDEVFLLLRRMPGKPHEKTWGLPAGKHEASE